MLQHRHRQAPRRILLLLLCLLLTIPTLAACAKENPFSQNGFTSLTLDQRGRVHATVTLDATTLAAHKGEKLHLYELRPGESASDATERAPLDSTRAATEMQFKFKLQEKNEPTRLYSSFVVGFEDGTLLSPVGYYIQNPEILAKDTRELPWAGTQKGLATDCADNALALDAMHVMQQIDFSLLESNPARVTERIRRAADTGLQVSLTVRMDRQPDLASATTLFDTLASATCSDGETAALTALFLNPGELTVRDTAALAASAQLALRSRCTGSRVYLISPHRTLPDTMAFFSDLQSAIVSLGSFPWGAAIDPALSFEAPWDTTDGDAMTLQSIARIGEFLSSRPLVGKPSYTAIVNLRYGAEDPDRQAASLAYAYRAALNARFGLVFYGAHRADDFGLLSEIGEPRPALSVFRDMNGTLSPEQESLCAEQAGEAWTSLRPTAPSHLSVGGIANLGSGGMAESTLFDFSDGDVHGFVGAYTAKAPTTHPSGAWDRSVLYTWLSDKNPPTRESGIRARLDAASTLSGVTALSTRVLTQIPDADRCTLRLRIDGTARSGAHLSYSSELEIENGLWQTATFQIAAFTADADPNSPCILSLTVLPEEDTAPGDYVFWVCDLAIRRPQTSGLLHAPYLLILVCVVPVIALVAVIYLMTVRRRRRR